MTIANFLEFYFAIWLISKNSSNKSSSKIKFIVIVENIRKNPISQNLIEQYFVNKANYEKFNLSCAGCVDA